MKKLLGLLCAGLVLGLGAPAMAEAVAGQKAPDFTVTDTNGKEVKLSDLQDKIVVLEWTNHECPFVVKHYETKNMQNLQKKWTDQGVVWISVVSSAEGKQGFVSAEEANKIVTDQGASPTHKILDPTGELGKLYGAKTTPHMFVIGKDGVLAYAGAIDDNSSPRASTVEGAKNYVDEALTALTSVGQVAVAQTDSYGCSVKY